MDLYTIGYTKRWGAELCIRWYRDPGGTDSLRKLDYVRQIPIDKLKNRHLAALYFDAILTKLIQK